MLELMARPEGYCFSGPKDQHPPSLEEVFKWIVTGWRPRNLAYGSELDGLEQMVTRGRCLEPLLMEGDVVYVDRGASPQPGDIVCFELSERMAATQNANLPPFDALPCKMGESWLKLFVPYIGIGMLHERYGHSMTATFAACENPDDTPMLAPVRQIRRNGVLLFPPECHAPQVTLEAASEIISNFSAAQVVSNVGTATVNTTIISITASTGGFPVALDAMCNADAAQVVGPTNLTSCVVSIYRDGAQVASSAYDFTVAAKRIITAGQSENVPITLSVTDTPSAGTHTYELHVKSTNASGAILLGFINNFIKYRLIKR
jgi:hypothetical protein